LPWGVEGNIPDIEEALRLLREELEAEETIKTAYYVALGRMAERHPTRPPTLLPYMLFKAQYLARRPNSNTVKDEE